MACETDAEDVGIQSAKFGTRYSGASRCSGSRTDGDRESVSMNMSTKEHRRGGGAKRDGDRGIGRIRGRRNWFKVNGGESMGNGCCDAYKRTGILWWEYCLFD